MIHSITPCLIQKTWFRKIEKNSLSNTDFKVTHLQILSQISLYLLCSTVSWFSVSKVTNAKPFEEMHQWYHEKKISKIIMDILEF